MSGRPYIYTRSEAIAHLMQDRRRPALKKIIADRQAWYEKALVDFERWGLKIKPSKSDGLTPIYILGDDLYICMCSTAEYLSRLYKLDAKGCWHEDSSPVDGWPTEEEIIACIAESAERTKRGGSLSTNDVIAFNELSG